MKTITIQEALMLKDEDVVFIDTRSPIEFEKDNIPGSLNIPLFSNEERAIVGTLYGQDKEKAYQTGFGIYNDKIMSFIEQFQKIDSKKTIVIYCWRGGMRSKTITELVTNIKENACQLIGGYKQFRDVVRERLEQENNNQKFIVLQGLAGCGKTDLIKKLSTSIDLEGMAKHRGSLFGAIGLRPVTQKMFESRLWCRLKELESEPVIFIEGEARKIGEVFIPQKIFEKIQNSSHVQITASIETRSKRIVNDYFTHNEDEKVKSIIQKLKMSLGNKLVEELYQLIDEKKYEQVAKILLEDYYDSQYGHALRNQKYESEISSDDLDEAVKKLEEMKK